MLMNAKGNGLRSKTGQEYLKAYLLYIRSFCCKILLLQSNTTKTDLIQVWWSVLSDWSCLHVSCTSRGSTNFILFFSFCRATNMRWVQQIFINNKLYHCPLYIVCYTVSCCGHSMLSLSTSTIIFVVVLWLARRENPVDMSFVVNPHPKNFRLLIRR